MAWTADNVTEIAVEAVWTNGRSVFNVWHLQREEDDPAESTRDFLNNWQDHIVANIADNYTLLGAHYRDRNVEDGVVGFMAPDPGKPTVGTDSGQCAPPNVAYLVHKHIEATAGNRPGRAFLVGVTEANANEDGVILAASVTGWNAIWADFLDGLSGAGSNQLVVVHKPPIDEGEADVSEITSLTIDTRVATQRRRMRA